MPPDTATLTPAEYQAHHGLSVLGGWLPVVIDVVSDAAAYADKAWLPANP